MIKCATNMGKSLDEYISSRAESLSLREISPDEARTEFEKLAIETGDPELLEYLKGKDIGRHLIYMHQNGDSITYPPIIEATEVDDGIYTPSDTPLNIGLFDILEVEVEKPSDVRDSFYIPVLTMTVKLEPVPTKNDLTAEEKTGLGIRKENAPFLRASI
jgi:hypothetical protein